MAQRVASIFAEVGLDAGDFDQGASTLSGAVDSLIGAVGSIHPAAALAISAVTALGKFLGESAAEAEESAVQMAKVTAVIHATGGAAGLSADEIDDMSGALSRQSGIDDELIASASGVLLSFRQVGEEVFPTAMQAALDMSAVMGQDLQSSVVQLGKALNDPIAGISALSRVGVTFSEAQKTQIENFVKQNDLASAQGVILKELESEFGGSAKAMNEASDGGDNVANAFGNLKEEIGTSLLPAQRELNTYLQSSIEGWQQYFIWVNRASQEAADANSVYERSIDILVEQGLAIDASTEMLIAQANGGKEVVYATQEQIEAAKQQAQSEADAKKAIEETTTATQNKTAAVTDDTEAVKLMTETNKEFLSVLDQTASSQASYDDQISGIQENRAKVEKDLADARAQGYWEGSDKIQGYLGQLDELNAKESETTEKYKSGVAERIFALTEQKLAIGGLTDAETDYLLEVGKNLGIYTDAQVEATRQQIEAANNLANGFQTAQQTIRAKGQEEQAKAGEYWKLAVEKSASDEQTSLDKSSENWAAYTSFIKTSTDANIQAVNEYINALGDIPAEINTAVNITTNTTNDLGESGLQSPGQINYYITNAYIDSANRITEIV